LANEWGIDPTGNAWSGRNGLAGWPDREPIKPSTVAYGDDLLPFFNVTAIVAALDYRRRTGKGQYIDTSMMEVCAQQILPAFLDWQFNGNLQSRIGNRVSNAAPHGVFPCKGNDRWCALTVFTESEWQAFCQVVNLSLETDPKFATLEKRKLNEDELENLVAQWTRDKSAEQIMEMMQNAGVPCGIVQTAQDIMEFDPQLKEREFIIPLKHPVLGTFRHPTTPFKLSKTKAEIRTGPCLGEHTEFVCSKLLGISDIEFTQLFSEGVFK
jgi:benzylsuccinate CoA-transferase BbsF subunit